MAHRAPSLLSASDGSIQTERPESPTVPDVIAIKSSKSGDNLLAGQTREQLKIVFSRRKRNVLYVAAIFHLPAVGLTLILLGLYISHATWPSPGPSNNVLNSIQFAAKVHEGLAFGSITQIVFHRLRYELLGERGLPFGLVTAAFQITSIPYFFSKQFWSPMRALRCSPHQVFTFTLLVSALVLVLALGPSSAIVMMPKLGWSPVSMKALASENGRGQRVTRDVFIGSSYSDLYTYNISGNNSRLDVCTQWFATTGDYPAECPSGGWRDLVASLTALFLTHNEAATHESSTVNLTVSALVGSRTVTGNGISWTNNSQENNIAYATTPSDFLMSSLNWKSSEILGSEPSPQYRIRPGPPSVRGNQAASWLQPIVIVQCAPNATDIIHKNVTSEWDLSDAPYPQDVNIDDVPFSFLQGAHKPFDLSLSTSFLRETFSAALNPAWTRTTTSHATFVQLDDQLDPPSSTVMIFAAVSDGLLKEIDLCIAEPSWIDSDIELIRNATASPVPWSGTSIDLEDMLNDTSSNSRPVIELGMDWMNSLNQLVPVIGTLNGTEEVHFFDYIASFCSRSTLKRRCHSVFLASFLADAISRSQNTHPSVYFSKIVNGSERGYNIFHSTAYTQGSNAGTLDPLEEDDLKDAELYTNIPFEFSRYVYGYRLDNLTIILAVTVLLLHLILVITHVLIGLLGSAWSSMAWSGLGELLALGIQSDQTPLLKNTGAGTSASSIWRLKTAVREVESEQRLQLVLCEQQNTKRHGVCSGTSMTLLPKADQEYG